VFGLSFGELLVLLVVAVVVLGPKELPRYLRKAGELAGRLRRMAYEMREKSGIDDVLRAEGIDRDIAEIRRLARGEIAGVVGAVRSVPGLSVGATPTGAAGAPAASGLSGGAPAPPGARATADTQLAQPIVPPVEVDRERELPREGPDAYGALPDTAIVYDGGLAPSPLAEDALYTLGTPP
jgi:sec-independent protein translocase protein TatB